MPGSELMESAPHTEVRPTPTARRGEITLVTGCMFSGKTTLLQAVLSDQPDGTALAIRHVNDDRYRTDAIVSHNGRAFPAETIRVSTDLLRWASTPGLRLLAIDEVHFLDGSLIDVIDRLARRGLNIMMAALDLDSWGRPFPEIERLARGVTHHIQRHGVCARCGGVADHTQRLTPIRNGRMVGGSESYEPRCAACWTPPREPSTIVRRCDDLRSSPAPVSAGLGAALANHAKK